jgi:hypothetical protein
MSARVGTLFVLYATAQSAHAADACPSLTDTASALRTAVSEARLEETPKLSAQAWAALLCQTDPMQPLLIGQTFQVIGAAAFFNGNISAADEAFTWAASTSPGTDLDTIYGKPALGFYNKVRDRVVAGGGATVALAGDGAAWIDGRALRPGIARDVTSGPHLLQTQEPGGPVVTQEVQLAAGVDEVVTVGATAAAAPAEPAAAPSGGTGPSRKMLIMGTGGALVATSAVLMALAANAHKDFDSATDPGALEGLKSKTNTLGLSGVATGLAGVGVLGAGVFLMGETGIGLGIRGHW